MGLCLAMYSVPADCMALFDERNEAGLGLLLNHRICRGTHDTAQCRSTDHLSRPPGA
ncbi:hypothetical protein PSEUDO8Z_160542 [Pseudomonas sp. 8Z]|nr:hypothetical protein PSEUDO8Z_160542 [Pseudomonas sp. 8Z]